MATKDVQQRPEEPRRRLRPVSNICEDEGKVMLRIEMPGVSKQDVEMHLDNNELSISGVRRPAVEAKRYILRERRDGDFHQVYTIDETVDAERIDASMNNGVLTITLPLREAAKPRKIQITSG